MNPAATAPLYTTYIGGTGHSGALGIAVDANGNAYVTGVTDAALARKVSVVGGALQKYAMDETKFSGQHWLQCVGGYEIAAMTGAILEAAELRLPLVVDGFIATAAAAAAFAIAPTSREVCFFSHRSDEQGHGAALQALGVEPLLSLKMRLGEGTGALLLMPLLDAAAAIVRDMATFDQAGIEST